MTDPLILFGGTFDPVHLGHVRGARAVSMAFGGAPVELMPNALPPHREQPGAAPQERLAMLQLACRDDPQLSVNDWELTRPGPSWTRLTLAHFRELIGQRPLVLVIGADSLANFQHWRDWPQFPSLCHLAVLPRPGADDPAPEVLSAFPEAPASALCGQPAGLRLMLSEPFLDVSATAIREALAENGACDALDPQVLDHIRSHGLYNVSQDASGQIPGDTHHRTRNQNGDA